MLYGKERGHNTDWSVRIFRCRHFLFSCRYKKLRKTDTKGRSRWPRGRRCGSAAARFLVLRFRIPPGSRMSVCCGCCLLSGKGLCVRLITNPEESYPVWCVWVWSWNLDNEEVLAHWGTVVPWKEKPLQCAEENNGKWETQSSWRQS